MAGLAAAVAVPLASLSLVVSPAAQPADASSHREAPMIAQDPAADSTDFYMFTSPENNGTVTFVANYWPFEDPFGGPNYFRFDENAVYAIKIDNNGDNKPDITYEFRFKTNVRDPKTFLYNTGPVTDINSPNLNVFQTYTVTRVDSSGRRDVGTNLPVPPVNIGPKSTPDYAKLNQQAIQKLTTGGQVFAGQRADPFFVAVGSLFDLLTIRKLPGNAGGGVNALNGKNVQSIVLQVPMNEVTADGQPVNVGDLGNPNAVIGAWQTTSRFKTQVLNPGAATTVSGDLIQVSRLGNPLVNEAVIPVGTKDAFNAINPDQDVGAGALPLVQDPEPARLLNALYGVKVPPAPRDDLVAVFLTGILGSVLGLPGGTAPMNVPAGAQTGSEMLRLNLATPPTAIGQGNRLGALGGDVAGFPNGRRLTDDVVDIELRALAGATYPLVHPEFTPDPLAGQLGDGVDTPDPAAPMLPAFPYLALPYRGYDFPQTGLGPFPYIRCATGRIYRLNGDNSIGAYIPDPATVGTSPILQASGAVSADAIKAICGDK
jgi:hypothetical protein